MLNGDTLKLHYKPRGDDLLYRMPFSRRVTVETAKTTVSKSTIARLHVDGLKPSPWFELKDANTKQLTDFAERWMNGSCLAEVMLR